MKITGTRQGALITNLSGAMAYKSFRPAPLASVLPLNLSDETMLLLSRCSRKLGEIVGMARFVPNAEMYLTMYVRKEALLSAQIEGTQCTFDDVLDPDNQDLAHQDVSEVVSYVNALSYAVERMKSLPLCTRLLRETHARLLRGTRGEEKTPGELRTSQNWIGPTGCVLREAPYVPPNVQDMMDALGELDVFINDGKGIDPVVKAALIHYQFETIHPFLDGNGRLGRLLITLSLINDGVLPDAMFYPSYQLKMRRREYYECLTRVREEGDYERWVEFFCSCILESAEDAVSSMNMLVEVHQRAEESIRGGMGKNLANGLALLDLAEQHPILDASFVASCLDVSRSTATNLIKTLCDLGVLRLRDTERRRYRVYVFEDYLRILRSGGDPLPR